MDPNPQPAPSAQPPLTAQLVYPAYYPPPPPRRSVFRTLLTLLLLMALAGSVMLNLALLSSSVGGPKRAEKPVEERYFYPEKYQSGRDKIAVMNVEGVIYEDDGLFEFVKRQIDRIRDDKSVKAVVVRVNSPGGTVSGSDYLYHRLVQMREERKLPLVVSMGGLAASGGYYLSMAVGSTPDSIYAEPSTWTGSIGVIVPLYSVSGLMERWGVVDNAIASGPMKGMGSFTQPLEESERQVWQELVDESFNRFKAVIRQGRPQFEKDPKALDRLANGQIYSADQAAKGGLVDKIGFVDDAIDRAIALAGLDRKNVQVVEYEETPSLADILTGNVKAQGQSPDLTRLMELSSPKAYYLPARVLPLR